MASPSSSVAPSVTLTPEQAALVIPLLQQLTASAAGPPTQELQPGAPTQGLQPTQPTQPTQEPQTALEGAQHYSIADMFRKKKRNTKSTPAQIFLHVSYN